jgi:type I restriction enzyme, S subunit
MDNKQINTPALRFPPFTEEWVGKKLGEVIEFKAGYAFKSELMLSTKSNYQLLKMSNVYQNELRLDRNPSFWAKIDDKQKEFLLKKGDTILTLTGTVGKQDYGYSVQIKEDNKYLLNQRLVLLREIKGKSDNDYISQIISNEQFLFYFFAEAKGGTGNQTNVSTEAIKNIEISFPTLPEQQKIAAFFTAIDKKLIGQKEKRRLLEQYKKGVMQQLFSVGTDRVVDTGVVDTGVVDTGVVDTGVVDTDGRPYLRFKDTEGGDFEDWAVKKLGDCLDYIQPTNYLVSSTEYDNSYKIPVLTAGKTFILGYTNEENGIFNKNLPVIIFDDFTTATQFVDFPFKAKSSAMKILIAKENVNIKFMFETMQIMKYEIGGHERHWISKFANIEIPVPSLAEQTQIANFLSALDEKIKNTEGVIGQMETWKKGLLQQMFV